MKSSGRLCLVLIIFILSSCGTGAKPSFEDPNIDKPSADVSPIIPPELEVKTSDKTPNDETWERVKPDIRSKKDLITYRDLKNAEAKYILETTADQSNDTPYYPVVITMNKPITLPQLLSLIGRYNPSLSKSVQAKAITTMQYLPKVETVAGEDRLIINVVKFESSNGRGQLTAETLSKPDELEALRSQIAERELNDAADFELIKGVTSIMGGVHRDSFFAVQEDTDVFLADIGPKELYTGEVDRASWNDVYDEVSRYLDK